MFSQVIRDDYIGWLLFGGLASEMAEWSIETLINYLAPTFILYFGLITYYWINVDMKYLVYNVLFNGWCYSIFLCLYCVPILVAPRRFDKSFVVPNLGGVTKYLLNAHFSWKYFIDVVAKRVPLFVKATTENPLIFE